MRSDGECLGGRGDVNSSHGHPSLEAHRTKGRPWKEYDCTESQAGPSVRHAAGKCRLLLAVGMEGCQFDKVSAGSHFPPMSLLTCREVSEAYLILFWHRDKCLREVGRL